MSDAVQRLLLCCFIGLIFAQGVRQLSDAEDEMFLRLEGRPRAIVLTTFKVGLLLLAVSAVKAAVDIIR